MAYDDEDLFEEEFDFGDDDEDSDTEDSEVDEVDSDVEEEAPKPKRPARSNPPKRGPKKPVVDAEQQKEEVAPEAEEPPEVPVPAGPPADHVVHIYEFGDFKRTIQREFTDEDAIKFAEEFNRTSKSYGRHAVPVERGEEPEPHL